MKCIAKSLAVVAVFFMFACNSKTTKTETPNRSLIYVDTTVQPQQDFYRFVNGKWIDSVQIPDDKTTWGGFNELRELTDKNVLALIHKTIKLDTLNPSSDEAKAIHLFKTIVDVSARNQQGIAPIKKDIEATEKITDLKSLQTYIAQTQTQGKANFFSVYVYSDAKDSNKNVLYVAPGQLGLPDRDYYVSDDKDAQEKKAKYKKHIAKMLQFLEVGADKAQIMADQVVSLETEMARARLDKVARRDPKKRYNPMSVTDLQTLSPAIDWKQHLNTIGIQKIDTLVVSDVSYFRDLGTVLDVQKVAQWKAYCQWLIIRNAASKLSETIETANWEFYSKALRGAVEQEPKEKIAIQVINGTVGEALGKLYVKEYFPPAAKQIIEEMIQTLIQAYAIRIDALPWMDATTKEKAKEKLEKVTIKVGYPNHWKNYQEITILSPDKGGTYYQNLQNIAQWEFKERISKLNKPVDKTEWHMAPQVVNAYYNPSYNEIVFPAAILQPPFFDFKADPAVNFGGIGAVIGHEISHGFDDSGADYDADGNLVNWWTEKDLEQFNALGEQLAEQFSSIEVLPDTFINGKFTLGENIGDLGGVNAAYDALQLYLAKNGAVAPIDGYTQNQRFFMSWANVWRTKMRDDALKTRVKTDPHSPGMYRATQPLLNIDAFYQAFHITEQDAMYVPVEKRVKIW
ncbi:M13 family metallopeptidase [Ochrovirga pacifica]|uniref:M13 family metallopeptidase n=1 Tax=Ochrovirga pacifica TaxID=1042376 RepID=UPI0002557F9C|nr:M13 family metallopeptidase [Ochrovirga pacifica]